MEVRKPKGGSSKAEAASSSKRRRKPKPTGPPPRLAWGAVGVSGHCRSSTTTRTGSASAGAGGCAGGLGGIGSAAFRSSIGSGSEGSADRKSNVDSDDDGLWADDDDNDDVPYTPSTVGLPPRASRRKTKKAKKSGSKPSHQRASLSPTGESAASMMWVDKYAPTNAADLCVAPKKVKEIREWMLQTASPQSLSNDVDGGYDQRQQQTAPPRLLVLVGSPGVGKSSTIHVLASELGWTVHQWNDALQNTAAGGGLRRDEVLSVRWLSQISSFEEFLASAGLGFSPLELDGGGLSLTVPVTSGRKRKSCSSSPQLSVSRSNKGSIILIEDVSAGMYNDFCAPSCCLPISQYLLSHLTFSRAY